MHQTRQEITPKLPLARKGTKYVARALHNHRNAVPLIIAVRDMLHLAKNMREVQEMIKKKLLKVNGKIAFDARQSIQLFNTLEADKAYRLTLLPTGKFTFEPADKEERLCKVMNKTIASKGVFQLHLHDGTTLLTKETIAVGDSVVIDVSGKMKKHMPLAVGKKAFVIAGAYIGQPASVKEIVGKKVRIALKDKETVIDQRSVVVL